MLIVPFYHSSSLGTLVPQAGTYWGGCCDVLPRSPFRKEGLIPPAAVSAARRWPSAVSHFWESLLLKSLWPKAAPPSSGRWHPVTDQCGSIKAWPPWISLSTSGQCWGVLLSFPMGSAKAFAGTASQLTALSFQSWFPSLSSANVDPKSIPEYTSSMLIWVPESASWGTHLVIPISTVSPSGKVVSVSKSWVKQRPHLTPCPYLQFVGLGFCLGHHAEMLCLPQRIKLYHHCTSPWSVARSTLPVGDSFTSPLAPYWASAQFKTGYCYFLSLELCAWFTHWVSFCNEQDTPQHLPSWRACPVLKGELRPSLPPSSTTWLLLQQPCYAASNIGSSVGSQKWQLTNSYIVLFLL